MSSGRLLPRPSAAASALKTTHPRLAAPERGPVNQAEGLCGGPGTAEPLHPHRLGEGTLGRDELTYIKPAATQI